MPTNSIKVWLCIVLLSYQKCLHHADPNEDWVKSHTHALKQAPKYWFAYIDSFFYQYQTQKMKGRLKSLQGVIWSQFGFVEIFKEQNASLLFSLAVQKILRGLPSHLSTKVTHTRVLSFGMSITWPLGKIELNSNLMLPTVLKYQKHCQNGFIILDDCSKEHGLATWAQSLIFVRFQLPEELAANFTFHSLEFVSGSVNFAGGQVPCQLGHVHITPVNETRDLYFCGHLSNFSVFPEFHNIDFKVLAFPSTVFHLLADFTVVDTNIVMTMLFDKSLTSSLTHITRLAYRSSHETDILDMFKIVVKKTEKILLLFDQKLCHQIQVLVFDGPGQLSGRRIMRQKFTLLSAFVTLLTVFSSCTIEMNEYDINYESKPAATISIRIVNSLVHTLPTRSVYQREQIYVLVVHAPPDRNVNLTVNNLYFEGQTSESCKFGGFVTAELVKKKYLENSILCKLTARNNLTLQRNYYSYNSSILGILYMFVPYSTVKATLTLKTSECKFINICPCVLARNSLCQISEIFHFENSSCMPAHKNQLILDTFKETWDLKMSLHKCVALNIARREPCSQNDQRQRPQFGIRNKLEMVKRFTDKFNLDVTVRGILWQPLTNKTQWRNCMFKCGYKSQVFMQNKIAFVQNSASALTLFLAQEYSTNLILELMEPLHAQNWLEVVVRRKPPSADLAYVLLGGFHNTSKVVYNSCVSSFLKHIYHQ